MTMQFSSKDAWNDLRRVQDEITRWATEQFPARTDHQTIFKLMLHEIPEMAMHKKEKGTDEIGPELADCLILLFDLASMWEVDVAEAIAEKMGINYTRKWAADAHGIFQHVKPPAPPARLAANTPITGMACPALGCGSKEIETTEFNSIYLYHCIQCGHEFDDDIPF